jgi:hypothetical protein
MRGVISERKPIKGTHLIEGVISEREADEEHVLRDEKGLYDARERLALIAVRVAIRVPDEAGHQGGHQGCHQGGHQRSSEVIREAIKEAIREVIRGRQRPYEFIRGHKRSSAYVRMMSSGWFTSPCSLSNQRAVPSPPRIGARDSYGKVRT